MAVLSCCLFSSVALSSTKDEQNNTKEAWHCMSHTVLEGRRITRKTNVITVHAMRGTVIQPLFYFENFLRFQVQGSITLRDFTMKSECKSTKKYHIISHKGYFFRFYISS